VARKLFFSCSPLSLLQQHLTRHFLTWTGQDQELNKHKIFDSSPFSRLIFTDLCFHG